MAAITEQTPKANTSPVPDGDGPDGLTHIFCCDPDVAHCGADIKGSPEVMPGHSVPGSPECVMCDWLEDQVCPRGCKMRQG